MKQQYYMQEISQLLSKFMSGETSVDEEWKVYKEMFTLFDNGEVDIELEGEMSGQPDNGDSGKISMLPKTVKLKPKILIFRWLSAAAACVLLLIGFSLLTKEVEPIDDMPKVKVVSDSVEVKHTIETQPTLQEEALAQCQPPKRINRRMRSNVVKRLVESQPKTQEEALAQCQPPKRIKQRKHSNVMKHMAETPIATQEETFAQSQQPVLNTPGMYSNSVKPQEENVKYMTDEMVDQLLSMNHRANTQQLPADYQEVENEIKRRGEQLTNDLLAFTTNN